MNNYVSKLNLPVDVDIDFKKYLSVNRPQIREEKTIAPASLVELLAKKGLGIHWLEVFVLKPGESHPIHVDGPEVDDKAKLNYILGGSDSKMLWYETNANTAECHTSRAGTKYMSPKNNIDLKLVHEETILGFAVVKVGILHTVVNPIEHRFCLSMALVDTSTGQRLCYTDAVNRLKDFIN